MSRKYFQKNVTLVNCETNKTDTPNAEIALLDPAPISTNIKGILFDVDGTLYHQRPLRLILIGLLVLSHVYRPRELVRKLKVIYHYRKAQEELRNRDDDQAPNNQRDQLMITAERCKESSKYVSSVTKDWFETKPLNYIRFCQRKDITKTIQILYEQGFKLGVFSDYPPRDKLSSLGVTRFFSTILSSHDRGVYGFKPNTNGFAIAAEKMKLCPSEILYVGDRHEVDGIGATQAGMRVMIVDDDFNNILADLLFNQNSCEKKI